MVSPVLDYDSGVTNVQRFLKQSFSALALLLLYIPPTLAQTADPHAAAVAELLVAWSKPDRPGVQVAVLLDGKVIHHVAVGMADLEQQVPVTLDSVFHAASVSKQFTAFAVLLLEQEGKLSIDDPLAKYIPEAAPLGAITLRQLLTHTSGLRDLSTISAMAGWQHEDLLTQTQAVTLLLAERGLNSAPGSRFEYINSDYVLLAEVVQRKSGKRFDVFCRERIFNPLAMLHTRFQEELRTFVAGRAPSWLLTRKGYERAILNAAYVGSTGLKTTADDLVRWASNFETGSVGGVKLLRRMEERGVLNDGTTNDYALGQDHRRWNGMDVWMHGGRDAGYRSFLLRVPQQRFALAVLGNASDLNSTVLAFSIADIYLRDHPGYRSDPVPVKTAPTAKQLDAYSGTYELFPGTLFTLSSDGSRLMLAPFGGQPRPLPALASNRFMLDPAADVTLEMSLPVNGKSSYFTYRISRDGVVFARRLNLMPFDPSALDLTVYSGRYWSEELGTVYDLVINDGRLFARHLRNGVIPLTAYQPETFSSPEYYFGRVVFQRDSDGRVSGFLLSGVLAKDVHFVRLGRVAP